MTGKARLLTPKVVSDVMSKSTYTRGSHFSTTIVVDSPEWFAWLDNGGSVFSYESNGIVFTVHRGKGRYWVAFKMIGGKLRNRYIGLSKNVTKAALQDATLYFRR